MAGLIFVVIAVAWIAFLVPWFVARKDGVDPEENDPMERFGDAVRYVARASAHTLSETDDSEVSTPLTRRAQRAEIRLMSRTAARRRRRVVLVLLALVATAGVLSGFGFAPVWAAAVPGGLLVGFLVLARFSVRKLNASLDARMAALEEDWNEDTINLRLPMAGGVSTDSQELSIEISAPLEMSGSLWDPIPVTAPTYVSKPLVPRTVRTIDLSAPEPTLVQRNPVVAEAPEQGVESPHQHQSWGRVVNE